ncbi:WD40-repeat-containing domain protein [Tribonema minus]|uniref:WD40-repeat-containing domain protein n=1 Tax=Tribonema minus TaxID=303371 RepID=A0A835Z9L4_9STRA|nr:WD40-repeat-containing domain protein [Tribonema minus]
MRQAIQLEQGGYVSCLAVTYGARVNGQTVRKLLASGSFENSIKLARLSPSAAAAAARAPPPALWKFRVVAAGPQQRPRARLGPQPVTLLCPGLLWDLDSGACVATLLPKDGTSALAFGPPGEQQRLVCGGEDRTRQWRLPSLEKGRRRHITGHRDAIPTYVIAKYTTKDRTLRQWRRPSLEEGRPMTGHCDTIPAHPRYSTTKDRTLRQWRLPNLEEGRPMTGHRDAITDLRCPDARTVVSCALDRTIHVWDADTGEQLASVTNHCEPSEQGPPYEDLVIVACGGKHEVMGLPRSEIMEHILVTPPAAAEPARAPPPQFPARAPPPEFEESRNVSTRMCPTKPALEAPNTPVHRPDVAATGGSDRGALDRSMNVPALAVPASADAVSALATPRDGNGKFVVLGAFDGSVRVLPWGAANMDEAGVNRLYWATTGDRIDTVSVAAPVHAVACSPDGHWIASGDRRGNIHVWRYHGADARGHGRGFDLTYFSHAMGWEKQRKTQRSRRHSTGSIAAAAAVFGGGDGSGAAPGPVAFAPRAPQMQPTEGSYCFERAHKGQIMALHITNSLDLVSSGCDGAVRVWDLRALVYAQRIAMARMRTLCRRREDAPADADAAVAKRTRRGGVRAPGAAERALALACALPEDALFQKLVSFV